MQAITHISPAIAAFFYTRFVVALAGITAPLAYFRRLPARADAGQHARPALQAPAVGGWLLHLRQPRHPSPGRLHHVAGCTSCTRRCAAAPIYGFFGFILAGELQDRLEHRRALAVGGVRPGRRAVRGLRAAPRASSSRPSSCSSPAASRCCVVFAARACRASSSPAPGGGLLAAVQPRQHRHAVSGLHARDRVHVQA